MKKILTALIGAMVFGCALEPMEGESVGTEDLALPVQAAAPCIRVTCDQAACPGALTITQAVPMGIGKVEAWEALQWGSSGAVFNGVPTTTVTQSPGSVVTRTTGLMSFSRNQTFCLLTSVVVRNPNGEILGGPSAPVISDGAGGFRLQLQPSAVTATVAP